MVYESLFQRSYDTEQCGAGKSQRNPFQWLGVPLPFGLLPVEGRMGFYGHCVGQSTRAVVPVSQLA